MKQMQLGKKTSEQPGILHLYHGSKSGITGNVRPCSRNECDFGRGFYMGTLREQAFSLVCSESFPARCFYDVELNIRGLNIVKLDGLQWALFVAYNRGYLEDFTNSTLYKSYTYLAQTADIIQGAIADDNMYASVARFLDGYVTDAVMFKTLEAIKLGDQVVAMTQRACNRVSLHEIHLSMVEQEQLSQQRKLWLAQGNRALDEMMRLYFRVGRAFFEWIDSNITDSNYTALSCSWDEIRNGVTL